MKIMPNIANCITVTRTFFLVPIVILLYFEGPFTCILAAILFSIASATDYIDGHIARKENIVTSVGKFLDPLADKLLISSILIMFVYLRWVPAWATIIIVCRELAVTGLRAMAADEGIIIAADGYGKIKTISQMFAIFLLLFHYPLFGINIYEVGIFFLYIALILTIVSGVKYFYDFYKAWVR